MSGMTAPRRRSWLWLQGLVCGAALTLAPAIAMLTLVLLAPGLFVYAVEETSGKPVGRTMLLLGAAASFGPLRTLWDAGNSLDGAVALVSDPVHLGFAWVVAGAGWLFGEMIQIVGREVLEVMARHRAATLRQERARLEAEWGSLSSQAGSAGNPG
jgi:hypothetical protein